MLKEALQYLIGLAPATLQNIAGLDYADKPLTILKPPLADDIKVTTLGGLLDLINTGFDAFEAAGCILHVSDPGAVGLLSKHSNGYAQRRAYVTARVPDVSGFKFGQFMDHESFIIGLQASFTAAGDREYLTRLASNLTAEHVSTSADDGISQQVGVKAGVVLKSTETIKNRVSLAPFRTFREVEQPASDFIFRVRQTGDSIPQLALFEADGGKWKIDAMETVGRFLRAAVGDKIPVIV